MGKHTSETSERRGSLKDIFARRSAGTSGRHTEARQLSAATVLRSNKPSPVLAAIAVPTAAIMAVAVAGFVGAPQSQADSEVVSQAQAPAAPGETDPTNAAPETVNPEDSQVLKEARKAADGDAPKGTVSLKTPEPKQKSQGSSNTSQSKSSRKDSGSSKNSSSSKESSSSPGRSNTEDEYTGSMSKSQIEKMLLDSANGTRWHRIAKCESNFNPRAVNPAGYYGLFQFSRSTWKRVGGSGSPEQASPQEQFKRAKILQAKAGWGQWGCK